MRDQELYPVRYGGKEYYEKDCDNLFVVYYPRREALNSFGGVYVADGLWVYPDGSTEDEES